MTKSYLDIANDLKREDGLIPIDYWNLQAYMHLQRVLAQLGDIESIAIESLRREISKAKKLSSGTYKSSNNYMQVYQSIVALFSSAEFLSNKLSTTEIAQIRAVSQAFFEADFVGTDALRVLEVINDSYGDDKVKEDRGTVDFHKKLLEKYTFVKGAVVSNPDSTLEEIKSIMGIGFDTTAHGRIPYRYPFFSKRDDRRQIPISLGCPVIHKNFSKTNLNPIFEAYVDSNLDSDESEDYKDHLDYVYINLQRHHDGIMPQVKSEFVRSEELHRSLNKKAGAAAISLPAYSSYFNQGMDTHGHKADASLSTLNDMFESIADSIVKSSNDFVIPDKVLILMYKKMFGTELSSGFDVRDKSNIKKLIKHSYGEAVEKITGRKISDIGNAKVDAETRMSTMSYFIKGTLTDQILDATNPKRYNITCKDAIDRAGTHNLLLGIHRKIKAGEKVEIDDVKRALDGLAMAYKHRPMNHQTTVFFATFEKLYYSMSVKERGSIFPLDQTGKPWPDKWLDESSPIIPSVCFKNTEALKKIIKPNGIKNWWKKLTGNTFGGKLGKYDVECSDGVIRLYLKDGSKISELHPPRRETTIQQIRASLPSEVILQEAVNIPVVHRKIDDPGNTESASNPDERVVHRGAQHEVHNTTLLRRHVVAKRREFTEALLPVEVSVEKLKGKMLEANDSIKFVKMEPLNNESRDVIVSSGRQSLFIAHKPDETSSIRIGTVATNPVEEDIRIFAECIIASGCKHPRIKGGNVKDVLQVLEYLQENKYQCEPIIDDSIMRKGTIADRAQIRGLIKSLLHDDKGPQTRFTKGINHKDK